MNNDRKTQTELYNHYVSILGNTALRYATSQENAKDILQEAFIKIFKSLHANFENQVHFEAWMKRTVINTALNYQRAEHNYKERILSCPPLRSDSKSLVVSDELLLACINRLHTDHRIIINLIIVDGYSHREVGELLGIKESSSRARYSRAIQMMRKHLTPKKELKL